MLETLHIENYALIRETDISFGSGFTAITGETGAGKSILLGALALVLGQRADTSALHDTTRKCVVEARFNIEGLGLEPLFEERDIDYDESLILRREILPSAKSRAFVNDTPVTLPVLKEVAARLVDIHSQHETLTLAEAAFQTRLLDSLGGGAPTLAEYEKAYKDYCSLKRRLETLTAADAQAKRDLDYNRFLFDELQKANLIADEQEELEREAQLMEHTEAIKQTLSTAIQSCSSDEDSALSRLSSAKSQLSKIVSLHPDLEELFKRLESATIELNDIMSGIESVDESLVFSAERQAQLNDRLDIIYRLQKKHGVDTVSGLIEIADRLDSAIQAAADMDEQIREAMESVDAAYSKLQSVAAKLTALRRKAAAAVEKQILPTLSALGMKDARLEVNMAAAKELGPAGGDEVTFLFSANKGAEPREIGKVASGGELSRLMLAIKSLISQATLLPTIIFDEIDTGVSGDVAVQVGSILKSMSGRMQVIAITHLPQIAATAAAQLKVYKQTDGDDQRRTASHIKQLSTEERVHEVAVMLSSDPPTAAAMQTARELMGL